MRKLSEVQVHLGSQARAGEVSGLRTEYLVERIRKDGTVIACPNKECDYERAVDGAAPEVAKT